MPITPSPIVILTGAGVSKESGLDTFRDKDGIWAQVDLEDVATPEAFRRDPERVHAFYNHRRRGLLDPAVEPNAAHRALARLEREWPAPVMTVTQNIDDLHERGGSKRVLHMHGELLKARCGACGDTSPQRDDLSVSTRCTACGQVGAMRPDIVWFGEIPMGMDEIEAALAAAGMFIAIGTSGTVYPAAGFVGLARQIGGVRTVELNLEPSDGAALFHESRHGPATEVVPAFMEELLDGVESLP
ncbi:MAG: NAD-dependent deacylase [Alphaproteobacteria bacterium]|nr:NAD-dependent deacylase [Alphaproteobacteria bacterium]